MRPPRIWAFDEKSTTWNQSEIVSVLITAFAASTISAARPEFAIEPETSSTSTTSFGPDDAATYHGRMRGS